MALKAVGLDNFARLPRSTTTTLMTFSALFLNDGTVRSFGGNITQFLPGGERRTYREIGSFSFVSLESESHAFPSSLLTPEPPAPSIPISTPRTGLFCKSSTRTKTFPVSLQSNGTPACRQKSRNKTILEIFVIAFLAPARRNHQPER